MEPSFWQQRWEEGRIGFHKDTANPLLVQAWPSLALPVGSRVLVPLAGKTRDLHWLRDAGMDVTGVELSPIACGQFFDEAGVVPDTTRDGAFIRWVGAGVTMLQGDVFDLPTQPFDAAWDRGCTVALPPHLRDRYAALLARLIRHNGLVLVVALDYPQDERGGPPFAIDGAEMQRLYGAHFVIHAAPALDGHHPAPLEVPLTRLEEVVWRMRRRSPHAPPDAPAA